jgi:hypothetical protein
MGYKELADYIEHLEERMDVEVKKRGKSEVFWELQDRLDRAYEEMDLREAAEWDY